MKKRRIIAIATLTLAAFIVAVYMSVNLQNFLVETLTNCCTSEPLDYSSSNYWYQTGQKYDKNKIDVFYILSTVVPNAVDENGKQVFHATLSDKDKKTMAPEYKYISSAMFDSNNFNFIAPYYRQMTLDAYKQRIYKLVIPFLQARADVCNAFDYYMEHENNGRPFIIAGFSQGALILQELLKHMTDEQYSRMIAAYSIGFQLTERSLKNKHFKPATGEDDLGIIVSYNSVASIDILKSEAAADYSIRATEGNAVTCINPVNWQTDDTSAEFVYNGDKATVHVDQNYHVLVVEGLDLDKYLGAVRGIFHKQDIKFYAHNINKNAIHRAKLFNKRRQVKHYE
ncbi:MAG: DUF3089 domain-containing protein [Synergistaceae bacterium]|nr:DUF3089 domain-containing protein [Synergistaceae bacterium]